MLPMEVLLLIFEHFEPYEDASDSCCQYKDLTQIVLVNRHWTAIGSPILYANLQPSLMTKIQQQMSIPGFLKYVLAAGPRKHHIKAIRLTQESLGWESARPRRDKAFWSTASSNQHEACMAFASSLPFRVDFRITLLHELQAGSIEAEVVMLTLMSESLQTLHLEISNQEAPQGLIQRLADELFSHQGANGFMPLGDLQNLLITTGFDSPRPPLPDVRGMLISAKIRVLHLRSTPLTQLIAAPLAMLTNLVLEKPDFDIIAFKSVLERAPRLRILDLSYDMPHEGPGSEWFSEVGDVLREHGLSLEELSLCFYGDYDDGSWSRAARSATPLGSLRNLRNLKQLHAATQALYGGPKTWTTEQFRRSSLPLVLPASLELLSMTCFHNCFTDEFVESLENDISLLTREDFPSLHDIRFDSAGCAGQSPLAENDKDYEDDYASNHHWRCGRPNLQPEGWRIDRNHKPELRLVRRG